MKYIKTRNSRSDCWFPNVSGGPPYYYNYPSSTATSYGYGICAILPGGAFINFYINDPTCPDGSICGRIDFDVNGAKGPNTYGKDIFEAKVLKDGIVPSGVGDVQFNDCKTYGWGCLKYVLANEDY